MKTTTFMLRVVKRVFPTFEFTWLGTFVLWWRRSTLTWTAGEEMETNLPLEMDFRASTLAASVAEAAQY